jgi:long-chain acyl-CoA synthetase
MIFVFPTSIYCRPWTGNGPVHPDVREAAVVGIAHPVLGEDVAAAVVPMSGAAPPVEDLLRRRLARLADNKVPRTILLIDALPGNQNGNVQKRELKPLLESAAAENSKWRRSSVASS